MTDTLVRIALEPAVRRLRTDESSAPRFLAANLSFDELVRHAFDQVRRDGPDDRRLRFAC